jgi:hypothetical protein
MENEYSGNMNLINEKIHTDALGAAIVDVLMKGEKVIIPELGYLELVSLKDRYTVLFKSVKLEKPFMKFCDDFEGKSQLSVLFENISIPLKDGKVVSWSELGFFHPIKNEDGTLRVSFTLSNSFRRLLKNLKILNNEKREEKVINKESDKVPVNEIQEKSLIKDDIVKEQEIKSTVAMRLKNTRERISTKEEIERFQRREKQLEILLNKRCENSQTKEVPERVQAKKRQVEMVVNKEIEKPFVVEEQKGIYSAEDILNKELERILHGDDSGKTQIQRKRPEALFDEKPEKLQIDSSLRRIWDEKAPEELRIKKERDDFQIHERIREIKTSYQEDKTIVGRGELENVQIHERPREVRMINEEIEKTSFKEAPETIQPKERREVIFIPEEREETMSIEISGEKSTDQIGGEIINENIEIKEINKKEEFLTENYIKKTDLKKKETKENSTNNDKVRKVTEKEGVSASKKKLLKPEIGKAGRMSLIVACIAGLIVVLSIVFQKKEEKLIETNTQLAGSLPYLAEQNYGNPAFWVYIYEANKDKLTSPINIPAKVKLEIPDLSEYNVDVNDSMEIRRAKIMSDMILKQKY